jgi:hypothetical protein
LPEINPIEEKYNDQEKQEVKIKKNSNILS